MIIIIWILIFMVSMVLFFTPLRKAVFRWIGQVFSRRKRVRAVLVSKVDTIYEDKMTEGLLMMDYGNVHKDKEAVKDSHWLGKPVYVRKLIFDADGKDAEFDVNDDIYSRFKEKSIGTLDYKGHKFYSFTVIQDAKDSLADGMGEIDYNEWLERRNYNHKKRDFIERLVISLLFFALFIAVDIYEINIWNSDKKLKDNGNVIVAELAGKNSSDGSSRNDFSSYRYRIPGETYYYTINVSNMYFQSDSDTINLYYETDPFMARPLYKPQLLGMAIAVMVVLSLVALANAIYVIVMLNRMKKQK